MRQPPFTARRASSLIFTNMLSRISKNRKVSDGEKDFLKKTFEHRRALFSQSEDLRSLYYQSLLTGLNKFTYKTEEGEIRDLPFYLRNLMISVVDYGLEAENGFFSFLLSE